MGRGKSEGRDAEIFLFGRMGVVFVSLGHEETDGTALRFGVLGLWTQGWSSSVLPTLGWRAKRLWRFFVGMDWVRLCCVCEAFLGLPLLGQAVGPRIFGLARFPGRCPGLS